jgi:aryl carrier-like protein
MRDIRGDLQDRANLFAEQISAAQDQFDKLIEQLRREQETRLADLKSGLDSVRLVLGIEDRRAGGPPPATNAQSELRPPHQPRPQPGQSHPDSLVRRVAAVSVR